MSSGTVFAGIFGLRTSITGACASMVTPAKSFSVS
jgi:hypothetical protein